MNQVDTLGIPLPFVWEDEAPLPGGGTRKQIRKLAVHPRTFEMESFFAIFMEERALAFVRRNKKNLSPAEYESLLLGCARDAASGEFEFGTERVFRCLHTPAGWAYNAYLQLHPSDNTITVDLVERIMKDPDKFKELDAKLARANDPNRGRPAPKPETPATPSTSGSSASPPSLPENPGS